MMSASSGERRLIVKMMAMRHIFLDFLSWFKSAGGPGSCVFNVVVRVRPGRSRPELVAEGPLKHKQEAVNSQSSFKSPCADVRARTCALRVSFSLQFLRGDRRDKHELS
jgi:hypothetical protein